MSKLSKVLSVLLAMVLLFSTASIGVEASYKAYKDSYLTRYDSIDRPVLTTEQYASMAMDEVDRMLGEANLKIEYDLVVLPLKVDLTSVDKVLAAVADLYKAAKGMMSTIGGDIQRIDFSALVDANDNPTVLRTSDGKTDVDIFLALLKFLADNAAIIAKVPYGSAENGGLDLGPILSGFVDLGDKLNVGKMAREALAKLVWPDKKTFTNEELSMTVDNYVKTFINEVASGDYADFKEGNKTIARGSTLIKKYLPGITSQVDLLNDSVYDLLNKGIKIALNQVAIPFANPRVLALLGRLGGYDYNKTKDEDGDTIWVRGDRSKDEPNAMANILNWKEVEVNGVYKVTGFNLDPLPVEDWDDDWIFDHLNDILGLIVREVINPDIEITWKTARGNAELKDNIISVAKTVLANTGDALFADYIEVLSEDQINAMDDDEFLAYILRSILNASISFMYIPNTCDTPLKVLYEMVRSLAADIIPSREYDDLASDPDAEIEVADVVAIGLDMAAYGLNGFTNMDLEYGLDEYDFADAFVEWVENHGYDKFLDSFDGNDGWDKIDNVLFTIIPANWLSEKADGGDRDDLHELIFTDVVENILSFDLDKVLALLDQNEEGELNNTVIEVLLARVIDIVNLVLPGVFPDGTYNNLDMLLDPDLLSELIYNLLTGLYDRASTGGLADALLPVACMVLGLSDDESFGYPYISLEDEHTAGHTQLTSFYMYNGSGGLNTAATDKNGTRTQDKLYTYYIRSVETNNPLVTVSPSENIYINGGDSKTFTLTGLNDALDSVLKVTITYDVYGEKENECITPKPLTATTYTYIYDAGNLQDDARKAMNPTNANAHLVYAKPTTYLSTDSTLGDLADYSVDMQRTSAKDSTVHQKDATISVTGIVIDNRLLSAGLSANSYTTVNTTKRGSVTAYKPYKVSAANASKKIDAGTYNNRLEFFATTTHGSYDEGTAVDETITFAHSVFVYDDYGLSGLLRNAVNADRQQTSYDMEGTYDVEYPMFGSDPNEEEPEMVETSISGQDAWDNYTAAVEAAAAIVYAPKQLGTMQGFVNTGAFEEAAANLYSATKELEACSKSAGTATIKAELDAIIAPDTFINEDGEEETYDYDDARHTYFGRADYVNYTYENFKKERRTAERILDAEKEAIRKNEAYSIEAVRAAYVAHRVSLYGERLIRVRAYLTHLDEAIGRYSDLYATNNKNDSGDPIYSNKTWNAFTRAYNFAVQVNDPNTIGSTIGDGENLADEGLRQTKVNEARQQLVKAAKKLTAAKPLVDTTQLANLVEQVAATYRAGISNYTELSWNTFRDAYLEAKGIVEDEIEDTPANQTMVSNAYDALYNAFHGLTEDVPQGGEWGFDPDTLLGTVTTSFDFESLNTFVTGLDELEFNVSDYITFSGCYSLKVVVNARSKESTGAVLQLYENDELLAEYPIVVYGDVNGDCYFDAADFTEAVYAIGGVGDMEWIDYLCTDENAQAMAADMNHDGQLDGRDLTIMQLQQGGMIFYNQAWTDGADLYEDLY